MRFGLTQIGQYSEFDTMLRELPAMLPTVTQAVTLACYQSEYGIFEHNNPKVSRDRPLALVAMHDKENVVEGGPQFSYIRRYHSHRIKEHFNLSLLEFFELPPHVVELLLDIASIELERNNVEARKAQQQIEAASHGR